MELALLRHPPPTFSSVFCIGPCQLALFEHVSTPDLLLLRVDTETRGWVEEYVAHERRVREVDVLQGVHVQVLRYLCNGALRCKGCDGDWPDRESAAETTSAAGIAMPTSVARRTTQPAPSGGDALAAPTTSASRALQLSRRRRWTGARSDWRRASTISAIAPKASCPWRQMACSC